MPNSKNSISIVATLGPSSSDIETIRKLIVEGVDVVRINMSHGSRSEQQSRIHDVRQVSEELSRKVSILADLTGPKLRIGPIDNDERELNPGEIVTFMNTPEVQLASGVLIPHPEIFKALTKGARLLINDGRVELVIRENSDSCLKAETIIGGRISSRKGITIPDVRLPIRAMTQKDKEDLELVCALGCDAVSVSFVQDADDIIEAKELARGRSQVYAKIERSIAVNNFSSILQEADGIILARGDLGIELPLQSLPGTMRRLTKKTRNCGKPVLAATQMLESMIESSRPTSAEMSYAASPIYDGANMILLSAETAAGSYPVESVTVLKELVSELEAELAIPTQSFADPNDLIDERVAFLKGNPTLTRVTAKQYSDQIDAELRDISSIRGNQLPDALEIMSEFSVELRQLSAFSNTVFEPLEESSLRLRIAHLEQLLERLKKSLEDEKKAKEAMEALAKKDGFWASYKKSVGTAAGVATVGVLSIGVPSAAVFFLGADHPIVQSVLTTLGRLPE